MLYGKATDVALTDVDLASSMTLMSADIERIVTGMETGHEVGVHSDSQMILSGQSSEGRHLVSSEWLRMCLASITG